MVFRALRMILLLGLASLIAWPLIGGLRSGIMRVRGGVVRRRANPVHYWLSVAAGSAAIALFLWLAFRIAFLNG
jgi:TctA family transporter